MPFGGCAGCNVKYTILVHRRDKYMKKNCRRFFIGVLNRRTFFTKISGKKLNTCLADAWLVDSSALCVNGKKKELRKLYV